MAGRKPKWSVVNNLDTIFCLKNYIEFETKRR